MPLQLSRRTGLIAGAGVIIAAVLVLWAGASRKPPRGSLIAVTAAGCIWCARERAGRCRVTVLMPQGNCTAF